MTMKRSFSSLLLLILLAGCDGGALSLSDARATAIRGGCWPYGVPQAQPSATRVPPTGTPTTTPTVVAGTPTVPPGPWPQCTPVPGIPTHTPTLTPVATARVRETPQPPGSVPVPSGNLTEIADQPGVTTNHVAAVHANGSTAIGWITWGWSADEYTDGQVWVRIQTAAGSWTPAQTLNGTPVRKGGGGLGLAWRADGVLVATWAAAADAPMVVMTTADWGATWTDPAEIGQTGSVISASADPQGGIHVLFRVINGESASVRYGWWPSGGSWRFSEQIEGAYWAAMALLEANGDIVRLIAIADASSGVRVYRSVDGWSWQGSTLESGRFMGEDTRREISIVAAPRASGAVVAVAWGQYSDAGVFAVVSTDGGATWGREERIAQHTAPSDPESDAPNGCCGSGWAPTLAYSPEADTLVAVWRQADWTPEHVGRRLNLSYRPLDPAQRRSETDWEASIPPTNNGAAGAIPLTEWGWTGLIASDPSSRRSVLLLLDERNLQQRIYSRAILLTGYLVKGDS